jgi:hypothetical protein
VHLNDGVVMWETCKMECTSLTEAAMCGTCLLDKVPRTDL